MNSHLHKLPATDYLFPWIKNLLNRGYDLEPSLIKAGVYYTDLFLEKYAISLHNHFILIKEMEKVVGRYNLIHECINQTALSNHGLLGIFTQCGPSLRDSISLLMRFQFLRARAIPLSFHEEGDYAIIRANFTVDLGEAEPFMVEMSLRSLLKAKQALVGTLGYQDSICLKYSKPCEHTIYDSIHPHSYLFGQDYYQLVFPRAQLDHKLSHENQVAMKRSSNHGTLCLQALNAENSLASKVEYLLRYCGPHFPSFQEMAQILNYSPRSLSRHLQQDSTNYKYLVDSERIHRVKNLLKKHPSFNLTRIANRLDFADSSHLTKVFKRHAGASPSQFRQTMQKHRKISTSA